MNDVPILGQKKEEVKDIFQIEKEFRKAISDRNEFIQTCTPQELYERQNEIRREENKMTIEILIDVVKYLADEKRKTDKKIVTLN